MKRTKFGERQITTRCASAMRANPHAVCERIILGP